MAWIDEEDKIDLAGINGEIWKQHPDESDKAYHCFRKYLELGRKRTCWRAYCQYKNRDPAELDEKEAPTHVYEWKKRYRWDKRVSEYDKQLDKRKRESYEGERIEYAEQMAQSAEEISTSLLEALKARFDDKTAQEKAEMLFENDGMNLEAFARTLTQVQGIAKKAFNSFDDEKDEEEETEVLKIISEATGD